MMALPGEHGPMDFAGKAVMVTGGSLGMGRACVERFAAGGAGVLAMAIDEASTREVEAAGRGRVRGLVGDVRRACDMEAAVATAVAAFGGLDILVCCAGIQRYGTVVDTPEEVWDDVLGVNLKGVFLAAKYAVPAIRKRGGGAIVAISSVQAYASQASVAAYTASKGGLNALVRAMALDHAPDRITVNVVCPASVDTPMLRHSADLFKGDGTIEQTLGDWGRSHPIGRIGQPAEIAEAVAFLASDKARFITGADLKVDGGLMSKIGVALPE